MTDTNYDSGNYWHCTALHEAGHAVAAWALGQQVRTVRMSSEFVSRDTTADERRDCWRVNGVTHWGDSDTGDVSASVALDALVIAVAGQAARGLIEPKYYEWDAVAFEREQGASASGHSDWHLLTSIADQLGMTRKQRRRAFGVAYEKACALLAKHWPCVVALHLELRARHSVDVEREPPQNAVTVIEHPDLQALAVKWGTATTPNPDRG